MDASPPELEPDDTLAFLVHQTARAITRAYGTLMAPLGLTRPQVRVLAWVNHIPGINQADLAEMLTTSPMALTGLLDRMEGKDLVKRVDDPNDRRVKRIYLTDEAFKMRPKMQAISDQFRTVIYDGVAEKDVATAVNVLKAMSANLHDLRE